jgi:hypothetical protein
VDLVVLSEKEFRQIGAVLTVMPLINVRFRED